MARGLHRVTLYYQATIASTWPAQVIVLSGDHGYWHVDSTVILYYPATVATGTWIAQGHVVLYGDHGYWHVDSTESYCYTGTRKAQGHTVLSGDHGYSSSAQLRYKPTQLSNFALFVAEK
jgi:hypothetical protein